MRLIKLALVAALAVAPAMTFAQTTAPEQPKNPIVKREFNHQQRRIGNGIKNDRLTPRQGARLERQQMRVHRQFRSMRARHNGRLTMRERRMIHRRQFAASRRIFRPNHRNRIG
jgi:Spy/CpxP family protein refolding chaperone